MIKGIIASLIFVCLLVAISIKLFDPSISYVELGQPFMAFMKNTNLEFNRFRIEIPSIPLLTEIDTPPVIEINNAWDVLRLTYYLLLSNTDIESILNGFATIINILIQGINAIISVFQFAIILLKNLITFKDTLVSQ